MFNESSVRGRQIWVNYALQNATAGVARLMSISSDFLFFITKKRTYSTQTQVKNFRRANVALRTDSGKKIF